MNLKNNNDNNKNNLENEIGAFKKLKIEFKNTIFSIIFTILKEQEISIYMFFTASVIMSVQVLIFPFHPTVSMVWDSPNIVKVIQRFTNFINIVTYLSDMNWNLYITFFYVGILIIGLTIINMVLVGFVFSRKKNPMPGFIVASGYFLGSMNTTIFIPFLDYIVSMLACAEDKRTGMLVHSYFSQVQCWSGMHILHSIFAIIAIIVFLAICFVMALICFEYRNIPSNASCRIDSRAHFWLLIYQTVMVICLTFLTDERFQILHLVLILIGSIIVFSKFYFPFSFHNESLGKLWNIIMAINLWTAGMLGFAKIMENNLFEGSIIVWLIGIPFVAIVILITRDPRINLLLINVNKFQSPQELQDQIRYLIKLIELQRVKKNSAVLLDGYIEIHKQHCNEEDCPLKQKTAKNNRFAKNLLNQDSGTSEKYARLIQLIYKMYLNGIKKFPNDSSLRTAYAMFLHEKMQSKHQALQELSQAEQNKPAFDEQFVIFRIKKIIEDEIAESQNDDHGLDVVSEVSFQNLFRQLQASVEKSALLHMEFWSQLSEDSPDLAKIHDIGAKINSSVQFVGEHWNKILKINVNNAKAMRLYGKYLNEIINDKEAGDALLEKALTLSNVQATKKAIQIGTGDDSSNDATPIVCVSGEQDKFGIITSINQAAASLFGYNKTELLNRKINSLMPQIYAKHHDFFLENYINSGEGTFAGKNKERLVFGKNKSQYIFPVYLSVKAVQSILQGTQFIATFRIEKNLRNTAYVLTHPDGTIDSLSSSSINMLKVDLKVINQKRGNIQDFIPNIIKDRHRIFVNNNTGKSSVVIQYTYPKDSEYLLMSEEPLTQLHCQLYDIIVFGEKENVGFQFRFERMTEKQQNYIRIEKKAKISNFQFRFDRSRPVIVGEYVEGNSSTDFQSGSSEDGVLGGNQNIDNVSDIEAKAQQVEDQIETSKINYAAGIRTLRLFEGRPQEIIEENEEYEEDEAESLQSQNVQSKQRELEENATDEMSLKDFSNKFKSRKTLTAVINDKTPALSIKSLKYSTNFFGIVILLITLLDYILANNEYDNINKQIDLLDKSNLRLAEMMNSLSRVRELYLINMKLMDDIYTNTTLIKEDLKRSLDAAKNLKEQLELETSMLSSDHLTLLNQPVIQLVGLGSVIAKKGLTQATEEVISRAFDILSRDIADINENNNDYYFVTYNLLNDLYKGFKDSSQFYAIELIENIEKQEETFLVLLAGSIAGMLVAILVFFPILHQVNKTREDILGMFFDIPEKIVKGLYTKCELFVSNLQIGEDDEMFSDLDEEEIDRYQAKHDTQDYLPRRRKKRFKNSTKNQSFFLIKIVIVALSLEGYFIYTYVSSKLLLEDIKILIPELNATSVAEPFFTFAINVEKQLFINSSFPILDDSSETVANNNVKSLYDLDSLIVEEHSVNKRTHSNEFINVFDQIMINNPCPFLTDYVPVSSCLAYADQTVSQGMTVALSRQFENLRVLLGCYSKKLINQTCTLQPTITKTVDATNYIRNGILNILRTNQSVEIDRMQHVYIRQTFRKLMRDFKTSLNKSFDSSLTIRLIIFIIYIVIVISVYFILGQTLIRKINNEIWRTKSMLNMIPLNVIAKIKSIRLYLKKFWSDKNIIEA